MSQVATLSLARALQQIAPAAARVQPAPLNRSRLRFLAGCSAILADSSQVVLVGIGLTWLQAPPVGVLTMPALGLVAAAMALIARSALHCRAANVLPDVPPSPITACLASITAIALLGVVLLVLQPGSPVTFVWLALWMVLSGAVSAAIWAALGSVTRQAGLLTQRVVLVGSDADVQGLHRAMGAAPAKTWALAGVLSSCDAADLTELRVMAEAEAVDAVILTPTTAASPEVRALWDAVADCPLRVYVGYEPSSLSPLPRAATRATGLAIHELTQDSAAANLRLKRMSDILLAATALLFLGTFMLVIAALIRLETPGPALFRQQRFGIGSRPIEVLKFRSMRFDMADPTGTKHTLRRDPRVTRIGRFIRRTSIDELPQLINVWRGDMSLVGPRPHPLHMRVGGDYYFEAVRNYHVRHRVRPGITGWAQINGLRGEVDTLEKARRRVELDLWYVENRSFGLDFWILLRTVFGGFMTWSAD